MSAILKQSTVSKFSQKLIPPEINRPHIYGFVYIPEVKKPFYNIGYDDPNGTVTTLAVDNDDPKQPLLKHPESYTIIGVINRWGVADSPVDSYYLTVWAPVAPHGYVSLGMVATMSSELKSQKPPSLNAVMCLRQDMAIQVEGDKLIKLWKNYYWWPFEETNYVYQVPGTNVMAAAKGSECPTVYVPKICVEN